jgi:hypothetical protein
MSKCGIDYHTAILGVVLNMKDLVGPQETLLISAESIFTSTDTRQQET